MRLLDLFSGIGGFSLGLERSGGFRTVAFCEIEPYCRAVLRKHWPAVPCYDDVRTLTADRLATDGISVDAICGGFPCQDISDAGKRAGLNGARSGLWSEFHRLIAELRPRFAIIENVAALRRRGLGQVLRQLHEIGYDAEWHCISAASVGAPHQRDRLWIVAYPMCQGLEKPRNRVGLQESSCSGLQPVTPRGGSLGNSDGEGQVQPQGIVSDIRRWTGDSGWWSAEPDVGRVAYGVPSRVDRITALGNAVVPEIPQQIGEAIVRAISSNPPARATILPATCPQPGASGRALLHNGDA